MEKLRKEVIVFLSKMAERRINSIPLDSLHTYTTVVKHISGVDVITPFEDIEHRLKYIDVDVFKDYPNIKESVEALIAIRDSTL